MRSALLEQTHSQDCPQPPPVVNVDADDLIVISSNSPSEVEDQQSSGPNLPKQEERSEEENLFELLPIPRPVEDEQARRRRIESSLELFRQFEEQEKRERAEMAGVMERRRRQREQQMEEARLRKEFEHHEYLPIETLSKLKAEFHQLETHYRMDKSTTVAEMNSKSIRFQQRKKLTRALRLGLEEIRHKVNPFALSPQETALLSNPCDLLVVSYRLMSELQSYFFEQLYSVRWDRNGLSRYLEQIKVVLKELNDRHNLRFRRDLISRRLTPEDLVDVREEDIECEEARVHALAKMKEFLKQHELQPARSEEEEQSAQEEKGETATVTQPDKPEEAQPQPQPICIRQQKAVLQYETAKTSVLNSLRSMQARLLQLKYPPQCGLLTSLQLLEIP